MPSSFSFPCLAKIVTNRAGELTGLLDLASAPLWTKVCSVKLPLARMVGLSVSLLFLAWAWSARASTWVESSFADFRDGEFLDGGTNLYVSARGRIQMINRWDLNGDGFLDIVMPAGHGHSEKENTIIYLNRDGEIDGRSRIDLPGNGSRDGLVRDLDKDGFNDLVVANWADSHFGNVASWIFWGSSTGFSAHRRTELPAFRAKSVVAGDFNGDSWIDLVFACQWYDTRSEVTDPKEVSLIYWNSPSGFAVDSRSELAFAGGVVVEDFATGHFDGDGVVDLVAVTGSQTVLLLSSLEGIRSPAGRVVLNLEGTSLAVGDINGDSTADLAIGGTDSVVVLAGLTRGHDPDTAIVLEATEARDVVLSDIDRDGLDDLVVANFATPEGATWTQSTIYYSDGGRFDTREPLHLPTLGASAVTAADLNGDGFPELVFSNLRATHELSVLSYVYWNREGDFVFGDHTQLATQGSLANAVGDVSGDGLPDVVFLNDEGGFREGPTTSFIYWGDGTREFTMDRRTGLPTHHVFGHAHADLDDDGRVDLVLSQSDFTSFVDHNQNGLIFYWGDKGGFFGPTNLTMESAYGGVRVADINKDGYLDLVAGGVCLDLDDPKRRGFPIFWGSRDGFTHRNRSIVPFEIERIRAPLLMDLNRDGWLDIAGQLQIGSTTIWWGGPHPFGPDHSTTMDLGRPDRLMYLKAADFNKDGWLDLFLPQRGPPEGTEVTSLIYYGSASGFSRERRIEIATYVAYQNSIVDFDRDGWLDIFVASYGGEVSGNRPSLIYWGGTRGFADRPRAELPTYGASGSETGDYDGDGWIDLLIANHRRSGSTIDPVPHRHTTESMLYWGGPDGFSPDRRWEVESIGPSGLNLRDIGNSYDRGLYEVYISSPHRVPEGERPARILWDAETLHGTTVAFQVRAADDRESLASSRWQGSEGAGSWFGRSGSSLKRIRGSWIQYRVRLTTPNGGPTPYLDAVRIEFE